MDAAKKGPDGSENSHGAVQHPEVTWNGVDCVFSDDDCLRKLQDADKDPRCDVKEPSSSGIASSEELRSSFRRRRTRWRGDLIRAFPCIRSYRNAQVERFRLLYLRGAQGFVPGRRG